MSKLKTYEQGIRQKAGKLGSDGCSGVPEFYHWCCLEHDVHYRTHLRWRIHYTHEGNYMVPFGSITRREADKEFRQCIQYRSKFGRFSPMASWRWAGVRLFGQKGWNAGVYTE